MSSSRYSAQQRAEFTDYALSQQPRPLREIAKEMGVGHSTLAKWLKMERMALGLPKASRTAEQERIRILEKEVAHLKEVNEIIKKAHVYFVNHPSR